MPGTVLGSEDGGVKKFSRRRRRRRPPLPGKWQSLCPLGPSPANQAGFPSGLSLSQPGRLRVRPVLPDVTVMARRMQAEAGLVLGGPKMETGG